VPTCLLDASRHTAHPLVTVQAFSCCRDRSIEAYTHARGSQYNGDSITNTAGPEPLLSSHEETIAQIWAEKSASLKTTIRPRSIRPCTIVGLEITVRCCQWRQLRRRDPSAYEAQRSHQGSPERWRTRGRGKRSGSQPDAYQSSEPEGVITSDCSGGANEACQATEYPLGVGGVNERGKAAYQSQQRPIIVAACIASQEPGEPGEQPGSEEGGKAEHDARVGGITVRARSSVEEEDIVLVHIAKRQPPTESGESGRGEGQCVGHQGRQHASWPGRQECPNRGGRFVRRSGTICIVCILLQKGGPGVSPPLRERSSRGGHRRVSHSLCCGRPRQCVEARVSWIEDPRGRQPASAGVGTREEGEQDTWQLSQRTSPSRPKKTERRGRGQRGGPCRKRPRGAEEPDATKPHRSRAGRQLRLVLLRARSPGLWESYQFQGSGKDKAGPVSSRQARQPVVEASVARGRRDTDPSLQNPASHA
jgi:hypothetical protein